MITRIGYSSLKGLPVKKPCYLATTTAISDLSTSAPDTVDGFLVSVGDRILVKDQFQSQQNGIYIVETVGTGNDGIWVREIDADIDDDFYQGLQVFIIEGILNGSSTFVLDTPGNIQIGVTGLTFSQLQYGGGGSGSFVDAVNGLQVISSTVLLGGTLSQNTSINGKNFDFIVGNIDTLQFTASTFDVEGDFISLDAGTGSVQILGDDGINIVSPNGELLLSGNSGNVNIHDGRGLVYNGSYENTFVTYSLITKKYVDDLYTTKIFTLSSGTNSIYSFATASYTGAFIDYTLTSNSNARSGNIIGIWNGSSVQFIENSTLDIGSTTGVTFSIVISGTYAVLQAISDTSGWTVKTIIRSI